MTYSETSYGCAAVHSSTASFSIDISGDYVCIVYAIVEDPHIYDGVLDPGLELMTYSESPISKINCFSGHSYNNCWYPIGIFSTHVSGSSLFYADFNNLSVPYHIAVSVIKIENN